MIVDKILGIVNKFIPDAETQEKIKSELIAADAEISKSQAQIITSEATGESWMQRNWRPIMMMVFIFIIFNNYILGAYLPLLGIPFKVMEIPDHMWSLLTLGMGGYIAGRSVEKFACSWKSN